MIIEYFALSDAGLIRANNEDAIAIDSVNQVVVLADGMGGYNAGEVASAMAITAIQSELGRWLSEVGANPSVRELLQAMEVCTSNANRAIFNAANAHPEYAGMGTTLVMGIFHGTRVLIGHVGDSRCYRLRAGSLSQLTRDHSLLQEHIDDGLISAAQAQYAPHRNIVTRALGVEETVLLEANEYRAKDGDLYLLCSDGLSDMITNEHIATLLDTAETLPYKAQALVDAANGCGGRDNISVILASTRSQPMHGELVSRMPGQQDAI